MQLLLLGILSNVKTPSKTQHQLGLQGGRFVCLPARRLVSQAPRRQISPYPWIGIGLDYVRKDDPWKGGSVTNF